MDAEGRSHVNKVRGRKANQGGSTMSHENAEIGHGINSLKDLGIQSWGYGGIGCDRSAL